MAQCTGSTGQTNLWLLHHLQMQGRNPKDMHRSENTYTCWQCGGTGHDPKFCWAREQTCCKCKSVGHFSHQCKKNFGSAKTKVKQIIEVWTAQTVEMKLMPWQCAQASTVQAQQSTLKMKFNGLCVDVIIDSGACVNVMGSHMFYKLMQVTHLSINNTHKPELFAYNCETKIPVLGKTTALVNRLNLTGSWCKSQMRYSWVEEMLNG